ncbi:hypothetical protein EW146_g2583 [Bondarzewia mesenterica]|uniref:Fatty acid desaturase domain-containing protein n=1 Tax=Bondarzewia mesenterica TaxID=1095465 RepID=A0A4S4M051_9AGAM|nr:hypothetical protein EW146_g2583 [Bondarzewia mesenterica]
MFSDSLEYLNRKQTPFRPPNFTPAEIHAAIPPELKRKSTTKAITYVSRDIIVSLLLYILCLYIDSIPPVLISCYGVNRTAAVSIGWILWLIYWWCQGIVLAGWWCLAHEAGHGNLSDHTLINHVVGFALHTSLLVPYYSWRSTHNAHHNATGSIERDENYVPRTRTYFGLPDPSSAHIVHYRDIFEETPLYTLIRMLIMQTFGWQSYLLFNTLGSLRYPRGTNHFYPSSALFKANEYSKIVVSNAGLILVTSLLMRYTSLHGFLALFKHYILPYLLANHWIVMLTFLQYSDPTIPHYRGSQWTFVRGALATVDRPLLGWVGRVFFHNVSHDHIAHHLFSFGYLATDNQPKVTEIIRPILGEHYNYDSTNSFYALYRSFTKCCFVENEGDILLYKDRSGHTQRSLDVGMLQDIRDENLRVTTCHA